MIKGKHLAYVPSSLTYVERTHNFLSYYKMTEIALVGYLSGVLS